MRPDLVFVERDVFRREFELAALRHGVARVDAQVHQHLIDLRLVAVERPQVVGYAHVERDILGQRIAQHPDGFADDVVEFERQPRAAGSAREG